MLATGFGPFRFMIDPLEIPDCLAPDACAALRAELRAIAGAAASLIGGEVRPLVRRATRLAVPTATSQQLKRLLTQSMPAMERHFGVALAGCEDPQFLRYEAGDFFVAHQDGNTPLIHDDSRFRKLSAILFLSRQAEEPSPETYGGGSLVLRGPYSGPDIRVAVAPAPGTLVAFRAETTHEVIPVTHGERFTVVTWFR
jgi:SM-20-related protein